MLYSTGFINHTSATPRNDAKLVMVVENSPKIFVQEKNRGIMSRIVNPEDMVINTHSKKNLEQDILQQIA